MRVEADGVGPAAVGFTSTFFTDKALKWLADYCETVRSIVGYEIPVATDHYGHLPIKTFIKFARRLDKYNLAWYEDDQARRNVCSTGIQRFKISCS